MKLEKICRMCSSEKLRVRPIFKAYKPERLLVIIKDVVQIDVDEGDGLPQNICKPCATTLIRIQENLEEFRLNDRKIRCKILGLYGEVLKTGAHLPIFSEKLNTVISEHQSTVNEDPTRKSTVFHQIDTVSDSILDVHNDQIEHISIADDEVTKEYTDDSFESQNQLEDCELKHKFDEDITNHVANDHEPVEDRLPINDIEMLRTYNHSISNPCNDERKHSSARKATETKNKLERHNSTLEYEPDESKSNLVKTEQIFKVDVYDEADTNDSENVESLTLANFEGNNSGSDYEPQEKQPKPKLKPIRASKRQRAARSSVLTADMKKRGRPPKYDRDNSNLPKLNDHKCYICRSNSLGSAKALLEHLTIHLDRTPYTCLECKMETVVVKSVRSLNFHMKMHAQPMKCQYCDRRYCDERARDYHVKTYHLGESAPCPSTCNECGKVCKSISALKTHLRDHRLNLQCEHCQKVFHRRSKLKDHIARVHEKAQKYECNLCKRVVHSLDSYNSHLKMHMSEKTYECDICPMKFYTAGNLGLHKKIHSCNANYKPHKDWSGHYTVSQEPGSDKIYTCKLCGKSYTKTVMKINNHLKSHFKDIKCDRCELMFVNESQLKVHYVVHTGIRQHKCDHCGKDFLHKNNLTQHLKIHRTERDYACEFCGKLFTYKEGMKAHIRNHHLRDSPYKCTRCRRKFVDNASLERHITAEHEPPPAQVDLGPPPLMGTVSVPQVPNFEAIVGNE